MDVLPANPYLLFIYLFNLTNFAMLVPCSFNAVANNFVLRGHFTSSSLSQILNYRTRNFHDL